MRIDPKEIPIHPIAGLIPDMAADQYAELLESIRKSGQREPAVIHEGKIIDGRNRQRACRELGIELTMRPWDGVGSLTQFVLDVNLSRRHLTADQRTAIAAEAKPWFAKEAKARQQTGKSADGKAGGRGKKTLPPIGSKVSRNGRTASANAAKSDGTSGRQVDRADRVKREAPDLFEEVKAGKLKLSQAEKQRADREKKKELERKAAEATRKQSKAERPLWTLIHQDVFDGLASVRNQHGRARLIFADPPYNIGVDYGKGEKADQLSDADYLKWCEKWLALCCDCLSPDGSLWLMIGDEYAVHVGLILENLGLHRRAWIKWYETFGNNCPNNFNRTSRHIFYCVRDTKQFVFNPDAVNRPSDRQAKYNDKRAATNGKIWDDVWMIPRVCGTSKERMPDFPTQLPLELVRAVVGCASEPGDLVIDPFNGSGTTGVAALELKRKYIGIDSSKKFIELANLRLRSVCSE
jgi:site-specific DNA-methyltransferase (adenine-specific)